MPTAKRHKSPLEPGIETKVSRRVGWLALLALAGCGGSNSSSPLPPPAPGPTGVAFISAPPTSLAVNASATLSAAAEFASSVAVGNRTVTWSVTCGSTGACGTFSANADAGAVTYTAPAAIPTGAAVTVTATSVADTTKSVSTQITIVAPIPISVSILSAPASLQVNAQFAATATVANDVSANPEVTWTVACGATACGSLSPTTTRASVSTTYTAPAAIPAGGSITLTATSVTDPTKSASVKITITAAAAGLANGTYVFQVAGLPGSLAAFVTGVFVASDGQITGGEQDAITYTSDSSGNTYGNPFSQTITGGRYAVTADGNLQISIALGPTELETLNGTLVGTGSRAFVAGLNGAAASGTLDLQTSIAAPSGGYALSLSGGDENEAPTWIGGVINIDAPGAISGAGSIMDVIDSAQSLQAVTLAVGASTVSTPDAQGRLLIQLTQATNSSLPTIYLAGYVIDATHICLIETGGADNATSFQGVLGGTALGQGGNTGQFNTTGVAGLSYVIGAQGEDEHGVLQIAGVLTTNADGSVTGTLNWNDLTGTAPQSPLPFTGTYTVDPTGRVTLSQLTDGATFNYSLHLYLAAGGNALLLSNDSHDAFLGQGFQRQSTPFTAASFNGVYGVNTTVFTPNQSGILYLPTPVIGSISAAVSGAGSDSVSGFADKGNGDGVDFAVTGGFNSAANGVFGGALAGLDPESPMTSDRFTLYLIDATQAVMIETDSAQLGLGHLENVP
jgi:hypothetical protein